MQHVDIDYSLKIMNMNRNMKRLLEYICIPVIMAIIGYGIICLAGKPLINMASNILSMVISDSTPDFKTELSSIYDEHSKKATSGEFMKSEIEIPCYEVQYGKIMCERLDMDVPLYWGDTDRVFRYGAGQYIGSFLPGSGSTILVGAHDSMYFAPLENVEVGDIFDVKTNYGEFQYKVVDMKISTLIRLCYV